MMGTPLGTADSATRQLIDGSDDHQSFPDLDSLRIATRKSLQPIARQGLNSAAKFLAQRRRIAPRAAYNFQFQTLPLGSAYDHELAVSVRLEKVSVRFNPMVFCKFSPEKHRWTLEKVSIDERAPRTRFEISFKCDRGLFVRKSKIGQESPRPKLRRMWRATFIMLFKPLSQIASRTDIRLCWARAGLQQVDVVHRKAGLPAVAWSVWAARLRQGYGALAPALDLRSAPSEGWSG
jgi:hypothetical protein